MGLSAKMAEVIGLSNTKILLPQKGHLRKLTTYVPESAAEETRQALFAAGAGHIGDYSSCSFNMTGEGTYLGGENTQPLIGDSGKLEKVSEHFVSVIFEKHLESNILKKSVFKPSV